MRRYTREEFEYLAKTFSDERVHTYDCYPVKYAVTLLMDAVWDEDRVRLLLGADDRWRINKWCSCDWLAKDLPECACSELEKNRHCSIRITLYQWESLPELAFGISDLCNVVSEAQYSPQAQCPEELTKLL